MKTIIFIALFIGFTSNAQTMTEKFNSLMNRYEYFNAQGHMVGYKSYDSLMKQWNYYEVSQQQQPQNTYVEPINLDYVNKALSTKQAKLDANVAKIDSAVNDIGAKIQNLDIDSDIKEIVMYTFQNALKTVNGKKLDYSNNNTAGEVINYLYKQVNDDITLQLRKKEELRVPVSSKWGYEPKTTPSQSSQMVSDALVDSNGTKLKDVIITEMNSLLGGYRTNSVLEQVYNIQKKDYETVKLDTQPSQLFLVHGAIGFYRETYKGWRYLGWKYQQASDDFHQLLDENGGIIIIDRKTNDITFYTDMKDGMYTSRFYYYNLVKDNSVIPPK